MSFKNLRSPGANSNPPTKEKIADTAYSGGEYVAIDDATVNGDRINTEAISDGEQAWGEPEALPGPRLPMKLK